MSVFKLANWKKTLIQVMYLDDESKPNLYIYIPLLCTACMMGWECLLQNIKLVVPKKLASA